MANTTKKVSIRALDKIMKENFECETTIDWYGVEVVVKRCLSVRDMADFVSFVVNICLNEGGRYVPELEDYAIRDAVVSKYSNVTLPEGVEHRYEILYRTDIFDAVYAQIDQTQYFAMRDAIWERIRWAMNVRANDLLSQMEAMISAFDEIGAKATTLFSGVNQEDIQKMVQNIASGDLSSDGIVKAYLENAAHEGGDG